MNSVQHSELSGLITWPGTLERTSRNNEKLTKAKREKNAKL
jgi:hypothetical protein